MTEFAGPPPEGGEPKPSWRRTPAPGSGSTPGAHEESGRVPPPKPGSGVQGGAEAKPPEPAPDQTLFTGPPPIPARPVSGVVTGSSVSPDGTMMLSGGRATADDPAIPGVTISREIGRGGMGIVYEGTQGYLDRRVAVKVLAPSSHGSSGGDDFTRRFQREAKILASLQHPNIVGCYQAGVAPNKRCFLVMEFIDGPTLGDWLDKNGALPWKQAVAVCSAVASALAFAHERGIIHRDVKPANVLLKSSKESEQSFPYEPTLADLGLARVGRSPSRAADVTPQDLTVQGTVMGSPPTMAPEQFDAPDEVDFRTDIYGLGCVLFHCLTGRIAFPEKSLTGLIASKTQAEPPDPAALRRDVPPQLAALVRSMLARKREERPASYEDLLRRLEGPFADAPRARSKAPWIALAALVVLGAGGMLAMKLATRDAPPAGDGALVEHVPAPAPDPIAPEPPHVEPVVRKDEPTEEPQVVRKDEPEVTPDPHEDESEDLPAPPVDPGPEPEPQPAPPQLAVIQPGDSWSLFDADSAAPLRSWNVTAGRSLNWSQPEESRNGAQALFVEGRTAAVRALPAPPWTFSGKVSLVRPSRAGTRSVAVVLMLDDQTGIALQQAAEAQRVVLGIGIARATETGWTRAPELLQESADVVELAAREEYEPNAPLGFRVSWDGRVLRAVWTTPKGEHAYERSREDLARSGVPVYFTQLGIEIADGSAILSDFVVEGVDEGR